MKKIFFSLIMLCSFTALFAQVNDAAVKAAMKEAGQYFKGIGGKPKDQPRAFALYMQCALAGNAKAMNAVGIQYRLGAGTAVDYAAALEWFSKAAAGGYAQAWSNKALMYKYGNGVAKSYYLAYEYFEKAASLNDPVGLYSQAYMLYKGLGCDQDYYRAYTLFRKQAFNGHPNAMYFLGLCYRNGYGTNVNADSAAVWLNNARSRGYDVAGEELSTTAPENADIAGNLASQIKAAQELNKMPVPVNTYTKIQSRLTPSAAAGSYTGYLLKYDWSGKHVVKIDRLQISLEYKNDTLRGTWVENDTTRVPLTAVVKGDDIVFTKMQYRKYDHYNQKIPELLIFENAQLQLTASSSGNYLGGNLKMYSPERFEPAKPMYIALVNKGGANNLITKYEEEKPLVIYPNPFTTSFIVEFNIAASGSVSADLVALDGKVVYHNAAGTLESGTYKLNVQPQQLAAGTYILRLQYGTKQKTAKVIKL